jgi:hypothetical protein
VRLRVVSPRRRVDGEVAVAACAADESLGCAYVAAAGMEPAYVAAGL